MANLTQTAANVGIQGSCQLASVKVGEAVTQGQPGYYNSSDTQYYQSDANASSTTAAARGIFLTAQSTVGNSAVFAFEGDVNLGATLTIGETYVVSATKGAICPLSDLTTGDYVTVLGVASAAGTLKLKVNSTGVAKP